MLLFLEVVVEIVIIIIKINRIFVKYLNIVCRYILKKIIEEEEEEIFDLTYYYESLVCTDYEYNITYDWYYQIDPMSVMDFSTLKTPEEIPIKNIYKFYRKYFYIRYLGGLNQFVKDVDNHFLDYHYGIGFVKFDKRLYKDLYIEYFYDNTYNLLDLIFLESKHYYLFNMNFEDYCSYNLRLPIFYINKLTTRKIYVNFDFFYENKFCESQINTYFYQFRHSYFYQNYHYTLNFIFNTNTILLTMYRSVFFRTEDIFVTKDKMFFLKIDDYDISLNQIYYYPHFFFTIHSYIWNPYLI